MIVLNLGRAFASVVGSGVQPHYSKPSGVILNILKGRLLGLSDRSVALQLTRRGVPVLSARKLRSIRMLHQRDMSHSSILFIGVEDWDRPQLEVHLRLIWDAVGQGNDVLPGAYWQKGEKSSSKASLKQMVDRDLNQFAKFWLYHKGEVAHIHG